MKQAQTGRTIFEDVETVSERAKTPSPRPRDASTLVLVRHHRGKPRVLLGKRNAKHSFMPRKYVFPGGAVDLDDGRAPSSTELDTVCHARLKFKTRRTPRAFALAAIRETFEETNLKLGRHAPQDPRRLTKLSPSWQQFFEDDMSPDLSHLKFIGRAITPPYRPKRFDARFFMVDADSINLEFDRLSDSSELSNLQWIGLDDTDSLDLPIITKFMIAEVRDVLLGKTKAPIFVYFRGNKSRVETIDTSLE